MHLRSATTLPIALLGPDADLRPSPIRAILSIGTPTYRARASGGPSRQRRAPEMARPSVAPVFPERRSRRKRGAQAVSGSSLLCRPLNLRCCQFPVQVLHRRNSKPITGVRPTRSRWCRSVKRHHAWVDRAVTRFHPIYQRRRSTTSSLDRGLGFGDDLSLGLALILLVTGCAARDHRHADRRSRGGGAASDFDCALPVQALDNVINGCSPSSLARKPFSSAVLCWPRAAVDRRSPADRAKADV